MICRIHLLTTAIIMLNIWNGLACSHCKFTPATTELDKFYSHVLKRRTRSVVFPKKAFLLLTPAFTKAVLDGRPRGLSYSMEFDMYSPLPDTIEGWKPKILLNKIKQEKALEDYKKLKEAAATAAALKAQTSSSSLKSLSDNYTYPEDLHTLTEYSPSHYNFPFNEIEDTNNWNYFQSKWDNDPSYFVRNLENPHIKKSSRTDSLTKQFHKKPYKRKHENSFSNDNTLLNYDEKWSSYGPPEWSFDTTKELPEWHHDQNYRERRHIFDQIEAVGKVFNFNMKACIQRAMCEITTHLKPYGESLMEDIIRLILTIPSTSGDYSDDYVSNYKSTNCEINFAMSCPYRVIDFLTQNLRSNL